MTLYILNYNNYYNREVLVLESITDATKYLQQKIEHVSFDPNDDVNTTQIINNYDSGDYMLCVDETNNSIVSRWFIIDAVRTRQGQYKLTLRRDVIADNIDDIKEAPMFVEKAMLDDTDPMIVNDEGLQLNKIKTSETLLKDSTGIPWIVGYTAKNMGATTVTAAADSSVSGTTLDYIAAVTGIDIEVLEDHIKTALKPDVSPLYVTNNTTLLWGYRSTTHTNVIRYKHTFNGNMLFTACSSSLQYSGSFFSSPVIKGPYEDAADSRKAVEAEFNSRQSALFSSMKNIMPYGYYVSANQIRALKAYEDKLVSYQGQTYKLKIVNEGTPAETAYTKVSGKLSNYTQFNLAFEEADLPSDDTFDSSGYVEFEFDNDAYTIALEEVDGYQITTTTPTSPRELQKEAFNMFVMPAADISMIDSEGFINIAQADACRRIANQLAVDKDSAVYDLQLLPYCPIPDIIDSNGRINPTAAGLDSVDYNWIKPTATLTRKGTWTVKSDSSWKLLKPLILDSPYVAYLYLPDYMANSAVVTTPPSLKSAGGYAISNISLVSDSSSSDNRYILTFNYDGPSTFLQLGDVTMSTNVSYKISTVGIMLWCNENSFTVDIDQELELKHSMKIDSMCDMYRLCSPNYQGSFDFNVAKNGGSVDGFRADCTYKPYNPYIRVYPNFKWLYGTDFGDARGLVCNGDFSLPKMTSAWETYQLNNKNYQNIFNREIASLDYNNSLTLRNAKISAITGAVGDLAKGAGVGAILSNNAKAGGIAGGIIGGVASTVAGIADIDTLEKQQQEARQLSIDKYSYQLGNIQAMPYSISKVGSFDINSKYFPFLEYYTCSEKELEAVENKIKYESMTVMRIGTMEEFQKADDRYYIKGSFIKLYLNNDTNLINAINAEMARGVYY